MVERPNQLQELAIVMELRYIEEEGNYYFIPQEVIQGIYMNGVNLFVNSEGNTYIHISDTLLFKEQILQYEQIKLYAFRTNIIELQTKFPDLSLNQLKEKLWNDCIQNEYFLGYYFDHNELKSIIVSKNKKTNQSIKFDDLDMHLFYELQQSINQYNDMLIQTENDSTTTEESSTNQSNLEEQKSSYQFNPYELAKAIKQNVFGQDEAIDKIVQCLWGNYYFIDESEEYNKENILVIGDSGVGKTEIFRQIEKLIPNISVHIADLSSITEAGIIGESVTDILYGLLTKCIEIKNGQQVLNIDKAEHAIIVLDEFDKIANRGHQMTDVGNRPVQEELLKIIEGKEITLPVNLNGIKELVVINTAKITFACCGAFEGITKNSAKEMGFGKNITQTERNYLEITSDDIKKYGFINELVGRLPVIVPLKSLPLEIFIKIIKNPKRSLFIKKLKLLKTIVQEVQIKDDLYEELASQAMQKKTGARGIDSVSANLFFPILNEAIQNPENSYQYAELDKKTVQNHNHYTLVKKKEKEYNI